MLPRGTFGNPFVHRSASFAGSIVPAETNEDETMGSSSVAIAPRHHQLLEHHDTSTSPSSSFNRVPSPVYPSTLGKGLSNRFDITTHRSEKHQHGMTSYGRIRKDTEVDKGRPGERLPLHLSQSNVSPVYHAAGVKTEQPKVKRKRPKFIRKVICQVCGDVANDHIHYGAISCYSCRAFFRRGVHSNAPYFCSQNQACAISKQTRKHCQYCRFQKCLKIGMKGSWVMTEEDKNEKKVKAVVRRRWHQAKQHVKNSSPSAERLSLDTKLTEETAPALFEEMDTTVRALSTECKSKNESSSSIYLPELSETQLRRGSQSPLASAEDALHSNPSILPSAAATARAVISASERELGLHSIIKTEPTRIDEGAETQSPPQLGAYTNDSQRANQSRLIPLIHKTIEESIHTDIERPLQTYHPRQRSYSPPSALSHNTNYEDPINTAGVATTDANENTARVDLVVLSTDQMREYSSDSSDSFSSYSNNEEGDSPIAIRAERNTFCKLLLKSKGKLTLGVNILNQPTMPFTREESRFVENVIGIEKKTTENMPISSDTLGAIMHAVHTGGTLSYEASVDGYMVCMKRIIQFATEIDCFREFCAADQRNLLLSNTDMLVNIRSARMLRPGHNLHDQMSVIFGRGNAEGKELQAESCGRGKKAVQKRLDYQQVYSSPWASGEDQERMFFLMMNNIFSLKMDQKTTALMAMMALFSKTNVDLVDAKKAENYQEFFANLLYRYLCTSIGKNNAITLLPKYVQMLTELEDMAQIMISKRLLL